MSTPTESLCATDAPMSPVAPNRHRLALDYLPVALFGSVMGLCGLSIAWRLASSHFAAPPWISSSIGAVAVIAFGTMAIGYGIKAATAPEAVVKEFQNPVSGALFCTIFISLLLLPIILAPVALRLAQVMWIAVPSGCSCSRGLSYRDG